MTLIFLIASAPLTRAIAIQGVASVLMGSCVAMLFLWVVRVLRSDDLAQGAEWRYDVSRMNELRRADMLYRLFYPLVGILARSNRVLFPEALPEIYREIQAAGLPRFWLPEEYLAKLELLAFFTTPVFVYVFFGLMGPGGLLVAGVFVIGMAWVLRLQLASRAKRRLRAIKRRMPFLLDLLTLLMEAGSTFLNAMNQAVDEFRGHPVAEEFGRVLTDMSLGKTRLEAFRSMRDRLADDEITSIIGTIIQGEELGTPLARISRSQADVLRVKRTQRAESVAGEAGVNMLLPGILVMAATVLIILGPFIMEYLKFGVNM
jgi:tight adherence protein C